MATVGESDARLVEVLEAAAAFFSEYLWTTEIGVSVFERMERDGVEEETVRAFGVGYAPGEHHLVLDHLGRRGYSAAELYEAGIATRSFRARVHSQFRSRITFPIRDGAGGMLGFAGMATNPGPSWPLWVTSPDRGRFDKRRAIFGIDRASAVIGDTGRAVVFRDCLEVLRSHQRGEYEGVAVIRCPITSEHVAQLAVALGLPAAALALERSEGHAGVVVSATGPGRDHDGELLGAGVMGQDRVRTSHSQLRPDPIKNWSPAQRAFLQIARALLGIGIPLIWLAIMQPDPDDPGGTEVPFVTAVGGVAATYVVLAIVAAIAAARVRARSRARRMRGAWEMGLTEWQPLAWTYHMLEDIVIGAAILSIVVCTALFLAIGGFTN